ncbi:unnamed protein product [Gulo gulo]|uniref:Uncharacterized protein n=1 Tax=Gulo gulo TaxID=48420 RepID=A0A9X9M801_GULGU|nr:unnamed protein product [Gulo gulo]
MSAQTGPIIPRNMASVCAVSFCQYLKDTGFIRSD